MATVPDLLARLAPWPASEFAEFGDVEVCALSRYQKLAASFLGRNWAVVPHVTHHDDIDITDCEARRRAWNAEHAGVRLTMVVLLAKVLATALAEFPRFNASLTEDGKSVVLKRYFNIGVAVETPAGLLVPVIRGCDAKDLATLAGEIASLAEKARGRGLSMAEMSGGSMSISSLGHIGGTAFTPIVNVPEVAILGVTRARDVPVRGPSDEVRWRTMLPVSLSYDHRVINGADAARLMRRLGALLDDVALFV